MPEKSARPLFGRKYVYVEVLLAKRPYRDRDDGEVPPPRACQSMHYSQCVLPCVQVRGRAGDAHG